MMILKHKASLKSCCSRYFTNQFVDKKLLPEVKFTYKPNNKIYNTFLESQPQIAAPFDFRNYRDKVKSKLAYEQIGECTKIPIKYPMYNQDWIYEGELLEGTLDVPHGRGRLIYEDGEKFFSIETWFDKGESESYG